MISTKPYQGIPNNIKNASYVFCDLAHYSEFVRTHELKAVMQYLKEYYDWIIPLAKEFHGRTVDILGDGMGSLFWGEDHAHHAFHFGLTILKELPTHHFPFSLKIGMSAGQVSDTLRMDKDMIIFTLVGQGVIEACRSENLSHKVHQNFLLTAHLYNLLSPPQENRCSPFW